MSVWPAKWTQIPFSPRLKKHMIRIFFQGKQIWSNVNSPWACSLADSHPVASHSHWQSSEPLPERAQTKLGRVKFSAWLVWHDILVRWVAQLRTLPLHWCCFCLLPSLDLADQHWDSGIGELKWKRNLWKLALNFGWIKWFLSMGWN